MTLIAQATFQRGVARCGHYGFQLSFANDAVRLEHGGRRFESRYLKTIIHHMDAELDREGRVFITAITPLGQFTRVEVLDDDPDFEFDLHAGTHLEKVGCYSRAQRTAAALVKKLNGRTGSWR